MNTESKMIKQGPCPECESSDAYTLYDDGHGYCFSCEFYKPPEGTDRMENNNIKPAPIQGIVQTNFSDGVYSAIYDRKIKESTAKKYNVLVKQDNNANVYQHIYKYYDSNNSHVANKLRNTNDKEFWAEGSIRDAGLFGQNLFPAGGKYVTLTEGEIDAMSIYQMMGEKWASVSIKTGAAGAVRDCKASYEYLNKFDNIVICFDNDESGKKAAAKVAQLFEPNKCKIVSLDLKDANEYLLSNKRNEFNKAWWDAEIYTPAGIVNLANLKNSLYEEEYCETCMYPWDGLNNKTYGMRTGELVTFTAGAGMGKSSITRELMHHILKSTHDNIGVLALEESIKKTAFNIMSVEANARLYIKEIRDQFDKERLKEWEDSTIGTGRFYAFDHFGSINNDEILNRVQYMAKALDCKWIILDHLSILVSGQEGDDERKSIDVLMTKLRSLVEQTGVGLLLVSHLRRPSGDTGHENGREVTLSHLRGSASIAHLSDCVIALERNQQSTDPILANTTVVRILKNRYTGDTGVATNLLYDNKTGRMKEKDPLLDETINEFEVV
jgi:twinkle protein